MSGMFDDEGPAEVRRTPAAQTRPPRSRALLITVGVLVALFLAMTAFSSFWTERLWFEALGYESVFTKLLVTRVSLFLVFGLFMAGVVAANIVIAYRLRPIFRPASPEQVSLDRYRDAVTPIRLWLLLGVGVIVGAFAGAAGAGKWREFLLWRNGVPFDKKDPYFDRDIGFYVFDLPWLHFLVDFLMAAVVVSLIAALAVHYLYGGIRLQSPSDRFSGAAAGQLSLLVGLFLLIKGGDYYLDRFDLLNESGSLITGITYTDDHAVLPAKNILLFISLICAVLFFVNVARRSWLLPSVGLGLFALSAILLGLIWPGIVQQFQVEPSQADKEEPYIARNIEATRAAYDVADSQVTDYNAKTTAAAASQGELIRYPGIRLVDPQLIKDAFDQLQQRARYYSVADVLDVDRYQIDGTERDIVIGVREFDESGLPAEARNWNNLHTVYTHGYGVIAAYGNMRDAQGREVALPDNPEFAETLETSQLVPDGYEPRIYFGEKSPDYSIVGKQGDSSRDVELDRPAASEEQAGTTTYDGAGGVELTSMFRQVLYAWKFGEPNLVLADRVHGNSKILYDRDPSTMVEKVAPWLTVDTDPLPAVVDGKVVWILDGFTTTDQYPLSQRGSYEEMTSDALENRTEFRTLPTDEINYMRNAVKATVDAYDGTVTLYAWDETDPMLQAWRNAFPGTVVDRDEIPESLLQHFRYPEDLFKVQRFQLARYHVTNAREWYENSDRWEVPEDPNARNNLQPPYRLSVQPDAEAGEPVFSLTSTYVPFERENLAAFVSVNSEANSPDYGTMQILRIRTSEPIEGPGQVANEFASDQDIADDLLPLSRANVDLIYGNLLTLPIGDQLMYVQPLYAVRSATEGSGTYPVLNFVLVSVGNEVGIGRSYSDAIRNVLGTEGEEPPDQEPPDQEPPDQEPPDGTPDTVSELLRDAEAAFEAANEALREGDLAEYQEQTQRAEDLVKQAAELLAGEEPAPEGE